jgi:hypothetical protein
MNLKFTNVTGIKWLRDKWLLYNPSQVPMWKALDIFSSFTYGYIVGINFSEEGKMELYPKSKINP